MSDYGIIVVCYANVCRSPIGEAFLKAEIEKRGLEGEVRVSSAGYLRDGMEAHPFSTQVCKRRGLDLRAHKSRILTPLQLSRNDLVLAMEEELAERARMLGAEHAYNLAPYATMGEETGPVVDPIGQPLPAFETCATRLEVLIPKALDRALQERS